MIWSLFALFLAHAASAQYTEQCQKCCGGLFETDTGTWEFENNNGKGWTYDKHKIRYEFENDGKCQGTQNFRQYGTAKFTFTPAEDTTWIFATDGRAEPDYERFEVYLNDNKLTAIKAKKSDECNPDVNTCDMCDVENKEIPIDVKGGEVTTLEFRVDSLDGYYTNNCFFSVQFENQINNDSQCRSCSCTPNPTASPVAPTPRPTPNDKCLERHMGKALNYNNKQTYSAERIACHEDPECKFFTNGGFNVHRDGYKEQIQGACVERETCEDVYSKRKCLTRADCYVKSNVGQRGWGECVGVPQNVGDCTKVKDKNLCQKAENCTYNKKSKGDLIKKRCYPKEVITYCGGHAKRRKCIKLAGCMWNKEACVDKTCADIQMRPEDRDAGASCVEEGQKMGLTCYQNDLKPFLFSQGLAADDTICMSTKPCNVHISRGRCEQNINFRGERCTWGNKYIRTRIKIDRKVEEGCLELDCTTLTSKNVCNQLECFWQRPGKHNKVAKCVFPTKN